MIKIKLMSHQKKGLLRNTIDKFYTNDLTCKLCYKYILDKLDIDKKNDIIIEPSAGNGSFIKVIKSLCDNYIFLDIEPEHHEIVKQDFLTFNFIELKEKYRKIHIMGNPPFGRQSSLAVKFIKYASNFCDSISFILPKSFKKDSMRNKFPLNFHCIYEIDLLENSFIVNDKEYNVNCVFQIYAKKSFNRQIKNKIEPINYKFVKKNENPDLSFRRVGVYAGYVSKDNNKSEQSHYFIKLDNNSNLDEIIKKIAKLDFEEKNDTVGPKSISKQELIKEFNRVCHKD